MIRKYCFVLFNILYLSCILTSFGFGQSPTLTLPEQFKAIDTPNDAGESILLIWSVSPSEGKEVSYIISTSATPDGPFTQFAVIPSTESMESDKPEYFGFSKKTKQFHFHEATVTKDTTTNKPIQWYYKLGMKSANDTTVSEVAQVVTAIPQQNWFKWNKINNFILTIILFIFIYSFIQRARRDPNLFIRRIPGLEAVEEAIGRATEMGKPILYLTGANDMGSISTIASVNILSHIAKKVASYDSRIIVPNRYSITMTVCQEVVREAYLNIGQPDAFNPNDIYYVTEDQFGFTAAVDGIMVREKPAANFFLGTFAAESIILAETGASTGAIQVAGTDSRYQLPFFIVACDYTLIGEELYAASAYLFREPKLLGSLRGQDAGKILLVICIVLATILGTIHYFVPNDWLLVITQLFTVR